MDVSERVHLLFAKYLRKECSENEFEEMLTWLVAMDERKKNSLSAPLKELWDRANAGKLLSTADQVNWDQVFDRVIHSDNKRRIIPMDRFVKNGTVWKMIVAAACITGIIYSGIFFFNKKGEVKVTPRETTALRLPNEVVPNGNNAILTLSNGKIIVLDSVQNGIIANQGNTKVIKLDSGQLAFSPETKNGLHSDEISYNTISTPRAAQYQLVLSDGTKVWLNAASSLRFPTTFNGSLRTVELSGEGYFEVTKNKEKPFVVRTGGQEVKVLGTHFDIMAYEDEESIQTTLIEGLVVVSHNNHSSILEPGKQSRLSRDNNNLTVVNANMNQAIAWKNGYFFFDRSDVKTIMRQVSRWYDLDIVYESPVPDLQFSGKIERNLPLSGITHLLESGQIHFRIEGKKCFLIK
jgi:transmembrane sensor